MDFRWLVGITLWTLLSGPVFDAPLTKGQPQAAAMPAKSK